MSDSIKEPLKAGRRVTFIGALLNGLLICLKFLAGTLGQSQALIMDAIHSVSDLFTDTIVLIGLRIGRKAPDETHHFGHARLETLASAVVGAALMATATYLGIKALWSIYIQNAHHPKSIALVAAVISIIFKEGLYHYTIHTGKRIKSPVVIANAWHHRSDALSSVAVLIGVAGAKLNPNWLILDACAAFVVSIFIIKVGFDIFKNAMREFTDMAPDSAIMDQIRECIRSVRGVIEVHDLRVRTSGGLHQMEAHIVVDGQLTVSQGHRIAKVVESCLLEEVPDLFQVIIHVDPAETMLDLE